MRRKICYFAMAALLTAAVCVSDSSIVLAAQDQSMRIISHGTGMDNAFDNTLKDIAQGFVVISRIIGVGMTGAGILMYIIGLENFSKVAFNWILGIGLAMNFGSIVVATGLEDTIAAMGASGAYTLEPYQVDLKQGSDGPPDILSSLFEYIKEKVVNPGSAAVVPIALKLTAIIAVIQGSYDVAFKLVSGDKIKYTFSMVIKICIIAFLERNWLDGLNIMGSLSHGFESLGYIMANSNLDLKPDSIVTNAFVIWGSFDFGNNVSISSPGLALINIIVAIAVVILLFLTAIEMFMARVEFYIMAMMVMPLIPFMITSKFSFLSDKAIGLMINLAIKVCTIAFMTGMMVPFFNSYIEEMKQVQDMYEATGVTLQLLLAALLMYLLTKNISGIVSGLLSGTPNLGGSMMTAQLGKAASTAAGTAMAATGNVAGAAMVAKGGGGFKGGLASIGKSAVINGTPLGKGIDGIYGGYRQARAAQANRTVTIHYNKDNKDN